MAHDTGVYEIHCIPKMYHGRAGLFGFDPARNDTRLNDTYKQVLKEEYMGLYVTHTDEEISKSLMAELEGLSDAEWAMLDNSDNEHDT